MKSTARLEYLARMVAKYKHCWWPSPSARLMGWVDEYDAIRSADREAFTAYCRANDFDPSHTAHDLLA